MWDDLKEGRGVTLDPVKRVLYISDGTSTITRVKADNLVLESKFNVTLSGAY